MNLNNTGPGQGPSLQGHAAHAGRATSSAEVAA